MWYLALPHYGMILKCIFITSVIPSLFGRCFAITLNDLINASYQINASYLITPGVQVWIRRLSLVTAPRLIDASLPTNRLKP